MKLYLARHGKTNYNELGLCNADPAVDVHLSEEGVAQAEQLAQNLKGVPFERIFVSTLRRTRQTADSINKYHDVPIEADGRIADNVTGFEGKPAAEYYAARDAAEDSWAYKATGAESLYDVRDRVAAFLEDLKALPYDCVLVVAHQCINRQLVGLVRGLEKPEVDKLDIPQGDFVVLDL